MHIMEALHIASILMVEYRRHAKKNITASITEMKKDSYIKSKAC
jgi:hypothetical protein